MTVHIVQVYLEPPKGEAETAVNNWVANHNEWEDDPAEHVLLETNTEADGSGEAYVSGFYRFIQEETATTLLDDLESRLQSIQGGLWYRIGYHECDGHDTDVVHTCEWEPSHTRDGGTVPSGIPTFG